MTVQASVTATDRATPGELMAQARAAIVAMENTIRQIDRGARCVAALGQGFEVNTAGLDPMAVTYAGLTLCDLTAKLIQDWEEVFAMLLPEKP